MQEDRKKLREFEIENLREEFQKNPTLFNQRTVNATTEMLKKIGISVPFFDQLPIGYLKLFPQDFIVEEEGKFKEISSVVDTQTEGSIKNTQGGETVYATLVKCNTSTFEAIEDIAGQLHAPSDAVQYAGIKDKNAITSQQISIRKKSLEEVKKVNSSYFFLKDFEVGNGVVEIGGLSGNWFTILIRTDQSFNPDAFLEKINKLERNGFYNFYYVQRFGTPRLIAHTLGALLLQGKYKEAVETMLFYPSEFELNYFQQLREKLGKEKGNWGLLEREYGKYPLMFFHELSLVSYLKKKPHDYVGALLSMKNQVQMWIYAFSSLLFNQKLSVYAQDEESVPAEIPLVSSDRALDIEHYRSELEAYHLYPFSRERTKPFPFIRFIRRMVRAREAVKIEKAVIIDEGVVMRFFLPKGAYATTFLSHVFQLVSGVPPAEIKTQEVDIMKALHKESLEKIISYF
ncbi:MAG: putative tRNA pseudouridine synthase D, partial [Parcubacteria group bacterium GW2011_GWC1_41_7]